MDETTAFDRQIANEVNYQAGPSRPVDVLAIVRSTATQGRETSFRPMFSATRFVVVAAIVALFGGLLIVAQPFEQRGGVPGAAPDDPGTFSPAGSMALPRAGHTATLLPDGRVLVVGGDEGLRPTDEIGITTAEVWDPSTATFSPAGSMAQGRVWHSATVLADGRVLVVGGFDYPSEFASAEVWDPSTATFSPAGSMALPRRLPNATLLPDGRVLITGGWYPSISVTPLSPEIWDPATSTFSSAGTPAMDAIHTATLLTDGRVLLVGDTFVGNEDGEHVGSAELWDPATSTFSPAGSPAMNSIASATRLADGRVLIVAGCSSGYSWCDDFVDTAEVWDPATSTFSPAGALRTVTVEHSATALPDGRVLIVGGPGDAPSSAEVWDPATASFGPTGSLVEQRVGHSATPLRDGRVLVVGGGWGDVWDVQASAEVWSPSGE